MSLSQSSCRFLLIFTLIYAFKHSSYADEDTFGATELPSSLDHLQAQNEQAMDLTAFPSSVVDGCVNVITGDYFEHAVDVVLPGTLGFKIERSYSSRACKRGTLQYGWDINHGGKVIRQHTTNHRYAYVKGTERNGTLYQLNRKKESETLYHVHDSFIERGLTNVFGGEISANTNLKNDFLKRTPSAWVRLETANRTSHFFIDVSEDVDKKHMDSVSRLINTHFPNGIQYSYQYFDHEFDCIKGVSILTRNKDFKKEDKKRFQPKTIASFLAKYELISLTNNVFRLTYSDEEKNYRATYEFKGSRPILHSVDSFNEPLIIYHYYLADNHWERLYKRELPDGRYKRIDYYPPKIKFIGYILNEFDGYKVKALRAPAGLLGEEVVMYQFQYAQDHEDCLATVTNALNYKTEYLWNKAQKRIRSVSHFDPKGDVAFIERSFWFNSKDPFIKGVAWEDGTRQLLTGRHFEYDERYNVKVETLYGNLTGKAKEEFKVDGNLPSSQDQYKIFKEYDAQERITSKTEGEITVTYTYEEKSDLITAELTSYKERIQIRKFYDHDESAALTLEIIDDGSSDDLNLLTHVTERKIKRIENNPLGLPLTVSEYALDLTTGQEVLLKQTENTYSGAARLIKQVIYGADGNYSHELSWDYDAHGNVTSETSRAGFTTIRTYDANDNLTTEIRPDGEASKEYFYDKMNRLVSEESLTEPFYKKTYTYDYLGHKTSSTDIWGNTTYYSYDHLGYLTETLYPQVFNESGYPLIPKMMQTCDPLGRVLTLIDPNGHTVFSTYNARGKPTRIDYPDGSYEIFYYTLSGQIEHSIERDGTQIKYKYDPQDREIQKIWLDPSGNICLKSTEKTYNAFHLLSETDGRGTATIYTYDLAGRMASKTTGNKKITYDYDTLGREAKVIEHLEDGSWIAHTKAYDAEDRIILESILDSFGNCSNLTEYGYNAAGKCIYKNSAGSIYLTEYDPYLRVICETDPLGQKTLFSYTTTIDAQGHFVLCKEATDCLGTKTVMTHDALGRIVHQEIFDSFGKLLEEIATFYDANGNKAKQLITTTAAPVENLFYYNEMGRIQKTIEAHGTPEQKQVTRKYDHADRLITLTKADGVTLTYTYDDLGRNISLNSSDGSLFIAYTYDLNDNILSLKDHDLKIKRSYNVHNQLLKESFPYGDVKYSYDSIGRLTCLSLPDHSSLATHYRGLKAHTIERQGPLTYDQTFLEYDEHMNPTKVKLPYQAGFLEYTYDLLNHPIITKMPYWEETLTFSNNLVFAKYLQDAQGIQTSSFSYDGLKRLLYEEGIAEHTYTYDMLGNASTLDGKSRTFNARNALLTDSERNYSYDLNGNRINDGKTTYSYDALDRLIAVHARSGSSTYQYDSTGRRLFKQNGNEKTIYLWQQDEEIGTLSPENTLLEFRALDPTLRPFALELSGKLYIPIQDAYGHIRTLIDPETNQPCCTYRYTAFGDEQLSGLLSPWSFAGKRLDSETGLIYFGKRYYDPQSLSWITPDPLDDVDGFNLYAYVHHNPLLFIDRDGCFALSDWTKPATIIKAVAITVAISTVVGWGFVGFAEGFVAGCSDGLVATTIDLAAEGATFCADSAAYAEMDAAARAYSAFKAVGKVVGSVWGIYNTNKDISAVLSAASTVMKEKGASAGGKEATAVSKTSRAMQ